MLVIFGATPILYVVTEGDSFDFGDVHADPDSALKTTVYAVPAVNPAIVIGLVIPTASENVPPLFVEY